MLLVKIILLVRIAVIKVNAGKAVIKVNAGYFDTI